jgi:hypothetical protein
MPNKEQRHFRPDLIFYIRIILNYFFGGGGVEGGPVGHKLTTRGPCIFFIFSWVGGPEGHEQGATNCRSVIMSH